MSHVILPLCGFGTLIMLAGAAAGFIRYAKGGSAREGMAYHGGGVILGFIPIIAAWLAFPAG